MHVQQDNYIDSLEGIVQMIPVIMTAVPADLSVAICDLEKFIAYFPGNQIDLNIKEGQVLKSDEPLTIALKQNRMIKSDVPAQFYGFEFTGTAVPLHNGNGQVIGGMAVQLRRQSELRDIADQMVHSLTQANERIVEIANGSSALADLSKELLQSSYKAGEEAGNTEGILSMIKRVADQTNLLGLNAAIEAARAGEKGKGFEVVAKEIRRFSKETVTSTQMVKNTLEQIQTVTKEMGASIEQIAAVGEEQAVSIQKVSSYIEQIKQMSRSLSEYTDKL